MAMKGKDVGTQARPVKVSVSDTARLLVLS